MKRNNIIKKLLKEGFTERTLSMLDDKQIMSLNKIMFNESVGNVVFSKNTANPNDIKKMTDKGFNVELREKDDYEEEEEIYKPRRKRGLKNRSSKFVEKLVENKYFHNFTSKGDIVNLIKHKLNEVNVGPNVKTGHNGIPEFMTYDSITKSDVKENETDTKTKPGIQKPIVKPSTPYSPKPGQKSSPKGLKENEPDTKTKPGTKKPIVKPSTPYSPSPKKPGEEKKSLPKGLK